MLTPGEVEAIQARHDADEVGFAVIRTWPIAVTDQEAKDLIRMHADRAALLADRTRLEALVRELRGERDEAREVVARVNNSFGSYGYFTNPHPADQVERVKADARVNWRDSEALRKLLWLRHGCQPAALYGDDGEMQCGQCLIDFRRGGVGAIEDRFRFLALTPDATPEGEGG